MSEETLASELLRPGLLEGVSVLLAGAEPRRARDESFTAAVTLACAELGAHVSVCEAICDQELAVEQAAVEQAVERALAESASIELLVVDGDALFAAGAAARQPGGESQHAAAALRACLQASWNVTQAVVTRAFLAREQAGRIVYLAPPAAAGEHAAAARAGLENLARTLSVEWARHAITVVTIAPGEASAAGEVAALTGYLASPAGAYFSGCLLDLSGVRGERLPPG